MPQIDPDQMRTVLNPSFVTKNEFYDPFLMWPLTIAAFQGILALRGLWTFSSMIQTGSSAFQLTDSSGNGQHLNDTAEPAIFSHPTLHYNYGNFNGSTEWYSIGDSAHWDILGTEAGTGSTQRGLTIGAWVNFDNTASAVEWILSKRQESDTQISYGLSRSAAGFPTFQVSSTGLDSGIVSVTGSTVIPSGQWTFVVGRFDPSTEMSVFTSVPEEDINTTSIPASIYAGTADLFMAGRDDSATPGQNLMDGQMAMAFIAASRLPDYDMIRLLEISRTSFGVD